MSMSEELKKSIMRPRLAKPCIHFSMLYTMVFEALQAFSHGDGADWQILAAFVAQPVAWVTSRGLEKIKAGDA